MGVSPLTTTLLAAKARLGLSFADLGAPLGGDEVWIAALIHGQASASSEEARTLLTTLQLRRQAGRGEPDEPAPYLSNQEGC